jgi:hypothetical protein
VRSGRLTVEPQQRPRYCWLNVIHRLGAARKSANGLMTNAQVASLSWSCHPRRSTA